MSATATKTRYFGKCPVKGCKTRRVVDGERWEFRSNGTGYSLNAHEYGIRGEERRQFFQVMRGLDLVCMEHKQFLYWEAGQFTYNPAKQCSAKCVNASGKRCDCSCRGQNHAGGHLISLS